MLNAWMQVKTILYIIAPLQQMVCWQPTKRFLHPSHTVCFEGASLLIATNRTGFVALLIQRLLQCKVPFGLECIQTGGSGRNASLLLWHKVRAGNRSESASQSTTRHTAERSHTRDRQGWWQRVGGSTPCDWETSTQDIPMRHQNSQSNNFEPSLAMGLLFPNLRIPMRHPR